MKKETLAQVFSCEFQKFLRTAISIEHLWWLFLALYKVRKKKVYTATWQVLFRSYFGPYFPAFGLNTDQDNSEYRYFLRSFVRLQFMSCVQRE